MEHSFIKEAERVLSEMNARFIANFITQDVAAHAALLHADFICIENSGIILEREQYLKEWATAYEGSGYLSFNYGHEVIRIFGKVALVRSTTFYTKMKAGELIRGSTVYTDTYLQERGQWKCIQAQITPVAI